jgi:hypothetical protein
MNRHLSLLIHSGLMVVALSSVRSIALPADSIGLPSTVGQMVVQSQVEQVNRSRDGLTVFGSDRGLPVYRGGGGTR